MKMQWSNSLKILRQLLLQEIQNLQLLKILKKIYGVQFHPEVTHTDNGKQIFKNFLFIICKIKKNWNVNFQTSKILNEIRETVKKRKSYMRTIRWSRQQCCCIVST